MSEPEPLTLRVPVPADNDVALIAVDGHGNHTAIAITRQAIEYAEPAAWSHIVLDLISKLDDLA